MIKASQISITMDNEPRSLERLIDILKVRGVEIIALSVAYISPGKQVKIIVDKPYDALKMVHEMFVYPYLLERVLLIDEPADDRGIAEIADKLVSANVDVQFVYNASSLNGDRAYIIMGVIDLDKAINALGFQKTGV